jgi:hypothetical protein
MKVKPMMPIAHPLADEISIQNSSFHYAGTKTSELAFFLNGEWVTEIIPEFADYADTPAGDTLVYGWVPNELIEKFLDKYLA